MQYSKYYPVLLLLTGSLLQFSCSKKNQVSAVQNISVSNKYVLVPDADTLQPGWSKDNTVVNLWVGDPDNLHPTNGVNAARDWILSLTSNYLLRSDPVMLSICPDIAVSLPEISDDHLRYTYTIRRDVRWDDGRPLTVDDIIFTYKANKCPLTQNPVLRGYLDNLVTIEKDSTDPYRLTMVMKREYILNVLLVSNYPIMEESFMDPQHVLSKYSFADFDDKNLAAEHPDLVAWENQFNDQKYGNDLSMLNGSGPYKVTEWVRGSTLTLVKKNNHWTSLLTDPDIYETSYPDKIICKIDNDPNAQKLEFRAQQVDASAWLTTQTALDLMTEPDFLKNYNIRFVDMFNYNYLGMNMQPDGIRHPKIFDDVRVRRAMAYLVPMDDIISVIYSGYSKRQTSMVSPLKPEYDTTLTPIPCNVDSAVKLLEAAGWTDSDGDNVRDKMIDGKRVPLHFVFDYISGPKFVEDMAIMIANKMKEAGVDVELRGVEHNTLVQALQNHDFDMYMGAWAGTPLPEDYAQLFSTASINGGSNYVGFGDAATDALIDSIRYTMDDAVRIPMVKRLEKIIYDQQPYVFMNSASRKVVIHKRFGNQYMTFDKPGIILNNLKLLSLYGNSGSASMKDASF